MPLLEWGQNMSVGIPRFDEQHRILIGTMNALYDGLQEGHAETALRQALRDMIHYTQTHFRAEERVLADHGYPGLSAHQEQHDALVKKVLEFERRFGVGDARIATDIMVFLRDWLTLHIMKVDVEYGTFLVAKGLG